jgi:hypothetical protein
VISLRLFKVEKELVLGAPMHRIGDDNPRIVVMVETFILGEILFFYKFAKLGDGFETLRSVTSGVDDQDICRLEGLVNGIAKMKNGRLGGLFDVLEAGLEI